MDVGGDHCLPCSSTLQRWRFRPDDLERLGTPSRIGAGSISSRSWTASLIGRGVGSPRCARQADMASSIAEHGQIWDGTAPDQSTPVPWRRTGIREEPVRASLRVGHDRSRGSVRQAEGEQHPLPRFPSYTDGRVAERRALYDYARRRSGSPTPAELASPCDYTTIGGRRWTGARSSRSPASTVNCRASRLQVWPARSQDLQWRRRHCAGCPVTVLAVHHRHPQLQTRS